MANAKYGVDANARVLVYRMIEEEPSIETEDESEDTEEPEAPER